MSMIPVSRLAAFAVLLMAAALVHAADAGNLRIEDPWARATPPGAPTAAVYFTIESAQDADRLVSVSTPVASHAGLHRSARKGGMATMKPVESVSVSPGAPVEFAPGGYHVMLMGLDAALSEGDRFPMTLHFQNAGDVTVEVVVKPMTFSIGEAHGHAH